MKNDVTMRYCERKQNMSTIFEINLYILKLNANDLLSFENNINLRYIRTCVLNVILQ